MKKSFGIILTICFALTAALQPAVLAQMTSGGPTPEELAAAKEIVVECDGSGATRQDALRDAMRKAIEKAVGMYVLSKTTMTDQELKEQVIVTSDAVVTNYKELKSEEEEGIWTVRIEARVLPNEYLKFCPKKASQDVSLEIGNLLNTMGSLNNTEAILDEIYEEDLFFKLYKFQKTEVKLGGDVELNGENVSLKVDFTASIDQDEYKKFQARICAFLDKIARHKMTAAFTPPRGTLMDSRRASSGSGRERIYQRSAPQEAIWKESGLDRSDAADYRCISVETTKGTKTDYTIYLVRKEIFELFRKKQFGEGLLVFSFTKTDSGKEEEPYRLFFDFISSFGSPFRGSIRDYKGIIVIPSTDNLYFNVSDGIRSTLSRAEYLDRKNNLKQITPDRSQEMPCKSTLSFKLPIDFAKKLKDVRIYPIDNRENLDEKERLEKAAELEEKYWRK